MKKLTTYVFTYKKTFLTLTIVYFMCFSLLFLTVKAIAQVSGIDI